MIAQVFLDTSYLLALVRKRDNFHAKAVAASVVVKGPFLTSDLVLIELANSLAAPSVRMIAVEIIERIRAERQIHVVAISPALLSDAFDLYKQREDKAWGLVDCASFVAMRNKNCQVALTFDEHFRQAGFESPLFEM